MSRIWDMLSTASREFRRSDALAAQIDSHATGFILFLLPWRKRAGEKGVCIGRGWDD